MIWLLLSLFLQAYVPQGATSLDDFRFPATYYDESSGRTLCYRDKCAAMAPAPVFASQLPERISYPQSSNCVGMNWEPAPCADDSRVIKCHNGQKFNVGDDLVPCQHGQARIPEGAYTLNVCATLENGRIWCDQQ